MLIEKTYSNPLSGMGANDSDDDYAQTGMLIEGQDTACDVNEDAV